MQTPSFPPLPLDKWQPTRDTLQQYAQVAGKVRRSLAPAQKHWWHVSLLASATGLTTTPMPGTSCTVEITLDLVGHALVTRSSGGDVWRTPLRGQSALQLCDTLLAQLSQLGAEPDVDRTEFGSSGGVYEAAAAGRYWQAARQVDMLLKQFRGEQRRETSPVQLWPHHFDWAMSWFSGRTVPGVDANDAGAADEQMAFGFSTGDETIAEPYFYVTAYPLPDQLPNAALPEDAVWHDEGFSGAVLGYAALVDAQNPAQKLLAYWRETLAAGQRLMDAGDPEGS